MPPKWKRFLCRLPLVRRRTSAGLSRMWSAIEVGKLFVPPKGDDRFAGLQHSCSRKCFTKHLRLCFLSALGVRKPEKSRTPLFLKNETHYKKGNHHHEAQNLYRPPAGGHHALRTHRLRQSGRRRFQQRSAAGTAGHHHKRKQRIPRRHGVRLRPQQLAGKRSDGLERPR